MPDVLVIGSGGAGLAAALAANDAGASVVLATKLGVASCNTAKAQGGIQAAVGDDDSIETHFADVMRSSHDTADPTLAQRLVEEGPSTVRWLEELGVAFTREGDGSLRIARCGGATRKRLLQVGDRTGLAIAGALRDAVTAREGITVLDHAPLIALATYGTALLERGGEHCFVPLEEVIGEHLGTLFPGMAVKRWFTFRITRYSDLDLGQIDQPDDLLETIEQQVFQRRFGEVVRLEVQRDMPQSMRQLLIEELRESETQLVAPLSERDVHDRDDLLELGDLLQIAGLEVPELRDAPYTPVVPAPFRDGRNIFDVIRERDVLVHHPYESFSSSVEAFLEAASGDPQVLAIKLTLYRTSGDTAIVRALTEAAEAGKQVAVIIELQARFDEQNNITFARTMESYGIHVAYGLPGLKTHAKTVLVVRRDNDGIRRYVHVSTGNYNSKTARLYTDIGLFTCNPQIGADSSDLFNSLTGVSRQKFYRRLIMAPANLRSRTLELIERESAHAAAGRGGRIIAKMNALVDPDVIAALYRASQAGVEIDLIVRGICCLLPGLRGVSERIRVVSIIGRFLEHSRIAYFSNGGNPEYYIGSADWMPRNFDRRVEAMAPIDDVAWHDRLQRVLETCLTDNRQAWELGADGTYRRRSADGAPERSTHATMMRDPWAGLEPKQTVKPTAKTAAKRTRATSSDGLRAD